MCRKQAIHIDCYTYRHGIISLSDRLLRKAYYAMPKFMKNPKSQGHLIDKPGILKYNIIEFSVAVILF